MKKFIGIQQWNVFFISLAIVFVLVIFALMLVGLNPLLSMIIPIAIVSAVFAGALIKGYRFFADHYPQAQDIKGQRYVSVPHKHVAIVLINGEYQGYLDSGFYFVFPFFGLVNFSETIFLGSVEQEVFKEGNKVEFSEGVTAEVKAVYNFRVAEVERYAFQDGADEIVNNIISSLARTALGDLNIKEAREGNYSMGGALAEPFLSHVRNEDPVRFDSILNVYGMEILAINISDISLSEEEVVLNRQRHAAKIAKEIATDKAEEMETLATAEAKVLELRGFGFSKQVSLLADAGCTPDTILAYLAETKKWESLKDTDKTFIIDNGKSVVGMLAALKGIEGGSV